MLCTVPLLIESVELRDVGRYIGAQSMIE